MKNRFKTTHALLGSLLLCAVSYQVNAGMITYDTWTTNEGDSGNYILTVNDNTAGKFDVSLTVDPWNAEALGLFIDFGNFDVLSAAAVGLSDITPVGEVSLFNFDTTSDSCGAGGGGGGGGGGCNLNGLSPPVAGPDGEWELVFRLGSQGFDGIQTFGFMINDMGLALSDWGLVGIRAQQLCSGTDILPDGSCGGSDKSYGSSDPASVPEPATLALLGLGLIGLGLNRRKRKIF